MEILIELAYLILFSFIGKIISFYFELPIPGSVVGMLLLLIFLMLEVVKPKHISKVSNFLIGNLAIFFVPAGVGIMVSYKAMNGVFLKVIILLILTTLFSLIFSAVLTQKLIKLKEKKDERNNK